MQRLLGGHLTSIRVSIAACIAAYSSLSNVSLAAVQKPGSISSLKAACIFVKSKDWSSVQTELGVNYTDI